MLTDQHRRILDFERDWWRYPGAKHQAIRERFDMTSVRYAQVLGWLIDQPEAEVYDAMGVRRLRRLRERRARARSARAS